MSQQEGELHRVEEGADGSSHQHNLRPHTQPHTAQNQLSSSEEIGTGSNSSFDLVSAAAGGLGAEADFPTTTLMIDGSWSPPNHVGKPSSLTPHDKIMSTIWSVGNKQYAILHVDYSDPNPSQQSSSPPPQGQSPTITSDIIKVVLNLYQQGSYSVILKSFPYSHSQFKNDLLASGIELDCKCQQCSVSLQRPSLADAQSEKKFLAKWQKQFDTKAPKILVPKPSLPLELSTRKPCHLQYQDGVSVCEANLEALATSLYNATFNRIFTLGFPIPLPLLPILYQRRGSMIGDDKDKMLNTVPAEVMKQFCPNHLVGLGYLLTSTQFDGVYRRCCQDDVKSPYYNVSKEIFFRLTVALIKNITPIIVEASLQECYVLLHGSQFSYELSSSLPHQLSFSQNVRERLPSRSINNKLPLGEQIVLDLARSVFRDSNERIATFMRTYSAFCQLIVAHLDKKEVQKIEQQISLGCFCFGLDPNATIFELVSSHISSQASVSSANTEPVWPSHTDVSAGDKGATLNSSPPFYRPTTHTYDLQLAMTDEESESGHVMFPSNVTATTTAVLPITKPSEPNTQPLLDQLLTQKGRFSVKPSGVDIEDGALDTTGDNYSRSMQNFVEGVEVLGDDEPSYPATGPNTHETPNSLDFGSQDEPVEFPTWANTETIPPNGPQQAIIKESSAAQTFFSSLKLYELVALSLAFVVFNLGIIIYEGKDLRAPQFRSVSFKNQSTLHHVILYHAKDTTNMPLKATYNSHTFPINATVQPCHVTSIHSRAIDNFCNHPSFDHTLFLNKINHYEPPQKTSIKGQAMAYNDITHYDVKSKRFKPSTPGVWVDTQCFSKYHAPTVAQTLTEIESTENLLCSLTIVCFAQTVANNTLKNQLDHLATFKLAKKQCDLQTKNKPIAKGGQDFARDICKWFVDWYNSNPSQHHVWFSRTSTQLPLDHVNQLVPMFDLVLLDSQTNTAIVVLAQYVSDSKLNADEHRALSAVLTHATFTIQQALEHQADLPTLPSGVDRTKLAFTQRLFDHSTHSVTYNVVEAFELLAKAYDNYIASLNQSIAGQEDIFKTFYAVASEEPRDLIAVSTIRARLLYPERFKIVTDTIPQAPIMRSNIFPQSSNPTRNEEQSPKPSQRGDAAAAMLYPKDQIPTISPLKSHTIAMIATPQKQQVKVGTVTQIGSSVMWLLDHTCFVDVSSMNKKQRKEKRRQIASKTTPNPLASAAIFSISAREAQSTAIGPIRAAATDFSYELLLRNDKASYADISQHLFTTMRYGQYSHQIPPNTTLTSPPSIQAEQDLHIISQITSRNNLTPQRAHTSTSTQSTSARTTSPTAANATSITTASILHSIPSQKTANANNETNWTTDLIKSESLSSNSGSDQSSSDHGNGANTTLSITTTSNEVFRMSSNGRQSRKTPLGLVSNQTTRGRTSTDSTSSPPQSKSPRPTAPALSYMANPTPHQTDSTYLQVKDQIGTTGLVYIQSGSALFPALPLNHHTTATSSLKVTIDVPMPPVPLAESTMTSIHWQNIQRSLVDRPYIVSQVAAILRTNPQLVKVCYRNAHCEYCGQKFLGLIDKCPTCSIIIKTASTFFKPFIILVLFKNAVELFEDITKPHTQRGPDVAISCDDTADRAGGLGLKIQFITTQRTPDYPSIPVAAAISTTMNTDVVATTLIYAFSAMFECGRRFMPIRIVSDSALEQHLGKHIASSVCRICMTPAVCVHHKNINQQQRVNDALKSILPVTTLEKTLAGSATITHAGLSATFRSFTLLGSPLHQIIGRAAILFHLTAFAKDKNLSLSSDSLAIFRQELSTIVNALRGKEPGQKLLNRTSPVFYTSTHHPNIDIAISNIFTSPSQRDITLKDSSLTRSLGSKIETRFRDTVQEARSVGERNKKAQDAHTASISTTIPLLTKPHELLALTKDPEVRFLASIFLEALAAVHSEVIKDTDGPGQQMPQLDQPPFGPQVPPFQPQMGPSRKGKVKVLQQLPVEEPIDETLLSIPLLERPLTRQQMQSYFFSSLNLPSTLNDAVLLTAFRTGRIGICNLPGLYTLVMCFNRKANKDAAAAVFPNASTPQSFLKTNFYSSLVSCLYAQGLVDAAATDIVTEPLKISPSIDFEHIYKYYGTPTATTTTTTTIASAFSSSDTPKDQNAQRVYSNQEMADIFLAAWFTDVTSSLCSVTEEATPSLISVLNQGGPQHLLFLDETKIGNILRKDLTSNPSEQLNRLFKRNIDDDTWHGKSGQLANISFRPLPPQPYQQSGPRNLQGLATQSIVAQNAAAADSRWIVEHDLTFHNPNRLNSFIDAQINGPLADQCDLAAMCTAHCLVWPSPLMFCLRHCYRVSCGDMGPFTVIVNPNSTIATCSCFHNIPSDRTSFFPQTFSPPQPCEHIVAVVGFRHKETFGFSLPLPASVRPPIRTVVFFNFFNMHDWHDYLCQLHLNFKKQRPVNVSPPALCDLFPDSQSSVASIVIGPANNPASTAIGNATNTTLLAVKSYRQKRSHKVSFSTTRMNASTGTDSSSGDGYDTAIPPYIPTGNKQLELESTSNFGPRVRRAVPSDHLSPVQKQQDLVILTSSHKKFGASQRASKTNQDNEVGVKAESASRFPHNSTTASSIQSIFASSTHVKHSTTTSPAPVQRSAAFKRKHPASDSPPQNSPISLLTSSCSSPSSSSSSPRDPY